MNSVFSFQKLFFPHDHKKGHFKALDGLRGLAVLLVLLSHSSNVGIMLHPILNFERTGKIGVYLFFVLSAYLLDRQIAVAFLNKKDSILFWLNYALRRFLRIYPLYFVSLLIFGLLTILGYKTVIDELWDIPLHLALMRGESIFWSILVEFKYYIISPFILWFCDRFLKWNINLTASFFGILILISVLFEQVPALPKISVFKFLPIFLVGTYISIIEVFSKRKSFALGSGKRLDLFGITGLTLIFISFPYFFKLIFGREIDFHDTIFFLPYSILWGLVLIGAKYGYKIIRVIFEFKPLRFLGNISFSLYLFHILFLPYLVSLSLPSWIKFFVFFGLAISASIFSFLLIEKPLAGIRLVK